MIGQAANPELSISRTIRLRGSAVSLSREAHKSQRKLDKLQQARRAGTNAQPAQTEAAHPPTEPAPSIAQANPAPAVQPVMQPAQGSPADKSPYAQTLQKPLAASRLSKKARRAAAKQAYAVARTNAAAAAAAIPPAA